MRKKKSKTKFSIVKYFTKLKSYWIIFGWVILVIIAKKPPLHLNTGCTGC